MPLAVAMQASAPSRAASRVGEAGVDHALLVAGKPRRRLGGVGEDEAGGQVERFGVLVELAAYLAGADGQGLQAILLVHVSSPKKQNPVGAGQRGPGFLCPRFSWIYQAPAS